METNYALMYPELTPEGVERTKQIIEKFKAQLFEVMNNTMYELTANLANEITDDDSWINVRQKTKEALCGYDNNYGGVDWVSVRRQILEENKSLVVNDIIQDKEKEIVLWQERYYRLQNERH